METTETKKEEKKFGLLTPDEMAPKGKSTGKVALRNFQYNAKTYKKDEEIKGLSATVLKDLQSKGLVE